MTISLERNRSARALAALLLVLGILSSGAPAVEALGNLVHVIVVGPDAVAAGEATRANLGQVDQVLPIIDGVSASVPSSRLDDLARQMMVFPDRAIKLQSSSYGEGLVSAYPREVGADDVWSGGNAGDGVTVALVDTGVADVPDLHGRVVAAANLTREPTFLDTYGHGTFQAGLIAGNGAASDGRYVGVAPEANLMSVKVADRTGSTSLGQVLSGVQLVDSAAERFNVRVMLLAVDSGSPLPPELDPLSWALRKVWSHGVVVVVPAGNDGPAEGTVASPGEDPVLLTAGSVDDRGTNEVADDAVSDFSAHGPTRWGDDKPDVAAPGEHLVSLRAPGSTVDDENPSARVEGAYFKGSGTSMAAAVTAGAAALMLAERPELNPDQVKALLMAGATPMDAGVNAVGAGLVDVSASIGAGAPGDLPEMPDMGPAEPPFTPKGLGFDWRQDDDGVFLWTARNWSARRWVVDGWDDDDWSDFSNAARRWAAQEWKSEDWGARRWAARRWAARQWFARSWMARNWAARSWSDEDWAARKWAARNWAARNWAARSWVARNWDARNWSARSWTDADWEARGWTARNWTDDVWEARNWSARSWNARSWDARSWDARSWDARSWDARSWDARSWDARSWTDDDWTARGWTSRAWTNAGWG